MSLAFFRKILVNQHSIPILLIGIFSLSINLLFFNYDEAPIIYPDTNGYKNIANQLIGGELPYFADRTFVYPLYLLPFELFGLENWEAHGQILIGIFPIIFLYLISYRLTRSKLLSLLAAMVLALDFQIVNFQSVILTETLSLTILMIFLYVHLQKLHIDSLKDGLVLLTWDLLLIFVRPAFLVLPIIFYLSRIVINRLDRKMLNKTTVQFSLLLIALNLLMIVGWTLINGVRHESFAFSTVSDINLIGKSLQYGFFHKDYVDPPEAVVTALGIYHEDEEDSNNDGPYRITDRLDSNQRQGFVQRKTIANFFIKENFSEYLQASINLIPGIFTAPRDFYSRPNNLVDNQIFLISNRFFDELNKLKLIGTLVSMVLLALMIRIDHLRTYQLGLMIITASYLITTIAFFGYGEILRLRMPVELMLNYLTLLPLILLLEYVLNRISNVKDKLGDAKN